MSPDQPIKISGTKKTVRRAKVGNPYFLRDKSIKKLQELVKRGYSYEKISEMLAEKGIKISVSTLKQYLDPNLDAVKRESTTSNIAKQKRASQVRADNRTKQVKVPIDYSEPTLSEVIQLSQGGEAFDFLNDEPDLYTPEDGDSVW
jgi:IS30 family transposase